MKLKESDTLKIIKQIKRIKTTDQLFIYIDKKYNLEEGDYILLKKLNEDEVERLVEDEK